MTDQYVDPAPEGFADFLGRPISGPIHMLNMIVLNDQAMYEDCRNVSGKEAYAEYSRCAAPFFEKAGGEVIWAGSPQMMLIGPQAEAWDIAFIAAYPSKEAFVEMVRAPGYQAIVHHRTAAVKTSRLICLTPASKPDFG